MQTKLIVGLGNVGSKYQAHRHNLGFMALDHYQTGRNWPLFQEQVKLEAFLSEKTLPNVRGLLAKPTPLMNRSGRTVQKLMQAYKLPLASLLVIHDELDLPLGSIRVRRGGSSGGHKGIASIIEAVGGDFVRIRIGIAGDEPPAEEASSFVLSPFNATEQPQLEPILTTTANMLDDWLCDELVITTHRPAG